MNLKKVMFGMCSVAFLFAITGCAGQDADKAVKSTAASPLVRIACGGFSDMPKDIKAVNKSLSALSEAKAGIRIELVPIVGSSKSTPMLLGDPENPVDIISLTNEAYHANAGALSPVDDLIQTYGPDIVDILGMDMIELGRYHGKIYGVPKPMPDINSTGVAVLTQYIKKYDIDVSAIKSMADLEPVLKTIRENEPQLIPYVPQMLNREAIVREVIGDILADNLAMVYYNDPSLHVVNLYETPEYEARVKMIRNWYLKGYLSKDILTNMEGGIEQVDAGMAFSSEFVIRPDEEQFALQKYGDRITILNFSEQPYVSTKSNTTTYWCISNMSKDPAAAMQALNLLYTDTDIINTVLYGLEGIHYVETGDGHITFPEGITPETSGYFNEGKWRFNRNIGKVWAGVDLNIKEEMTAYNASAIVSPAYGFQFDEEESSVDTKKIQAVINTYALKLGCGLLDVDVALPAFQNALRDAGADQLVQEVQRQLDGWQEQNHTNKK